MSTLFEYEKTEVEKGYYILRISLQDSELIIAEHLSGSWYQPGADYDVWRWSGDPMPKIEIICKLDLDKIAVAAEAEEPLSPVDSRELIERLVKALRNMLAMTDPYREERGTEAEIAARRDAVAALNAFDSAALTAKEQQP